MNISPGHTLYFKLPFADGGSCNYKRLFLVVGIEDGLVKLLNCSSTVGKEWKLLMDSNREIKIYNPPFRKPSFVKLDALYTIDYYDDLVNSIIGQGLLFQRELDGIVSDHLIYQQRHSILQVHYSHDDVVAYNLE